MKDGCHFFSIFGQGKVAQKSKSGWFRANIPLWIDIKLSSFFFFFSEASPGGVGLAWVGDVVTLGFPQLWASRLGRGVSLILLASLCYTHRHRPPALLLLQLYIWGSSARLWYTAHFSKRRPKLSHLTSAFQILWSPGIGQDKFCTLSLFFVFFFFFYFKCVS